MNCVQVQAASYGPGLIGCGFLLRQGTGRVLEKKFGYWDGTGKGKFQFSHFLHIHFFMIKKPIKAVRVCGGEVMGDIALPRKLPSLPPVARRSPSAIGVYKYLQTS